ncbi:metal ABC transporter permease [Mesobacillus maritimus]|uniref:Metal ABC transporter permease n=1 Tax=Mesobacillus maritimus TaxID=1643336 RepID=A0ABS7KC09_9BACI|nr:metal ABC transporter permease [Mesobacillus maritimus]
MISLLFTACNTEKGIPVLVLHYLLIALVSITTFVFIYVVGASMVVAMLITPAVTASLWTDKPLTPN